MGSQDSAAASGAMPTTGAGTMRQTALARKHNWPVCRCQFHNRSWCTSWVGNVPTPRRRRGPAKVADDSGDKTMSTSTFGHLGSVSFPLRTGHPESRQYLPGEDVL